MSTFCRRVYKSFVDNIDPSPSCRKPNDFSNTVATIDGVNTASYRCLRGYRGLDNLWSVGEGPGNRKQINVKIDHNFSQKHRGNVNVSVERVVSDD